jgi:hypothetical protein
MRVLITLLALLTAAHPQECRMGGVLPVVAVDRKDDVASIDATALRATVGADQVRVSEVAYASGPPLLVVLDRDIAERSDAWQSALVLVQWVLERLHPEREAAVVEYDSGRLVHQKDFARTAEILSYVKALPDAPVIRAQNPRGRDKRIPMLTRLAEFINGSEKLQGGIVLVITDYGRRSGGNELKRAALGRGTAISAAVLEPSAAWALGYSTSDLEEVVEATGGVSLVVAPMAGRINLLDDSRITQNIPRLDAAPPLRGAPRQQSANFEHHTYSLRERAEKFVKQLAGYKLLRIDRNNADGAKLKIEIAGHKDVIIRHPRRAPKCQ